MTWKDQINTQINEFLNNAGFLNTETIHEIDTEAFIKKKVLVIPENTPNTNRIVTFEAYIDIDSNTFYLEISENLANLKFSPENTAL